MLNRYFIIEKSNPNYNTIINCIVGEEETQRESLDGLSVVVKLPLNDVENHTCLNGLTEYTHSEIKVEMRKPEWTNEII